MSTTKTPDDLRTLEDFRAAFEAIPDESWCTGDFVRVDEDDDGEPVERRCAAGHLGAGIDGLKEEIRMVEAVRRLDALLAPAWPVELFPSDHGHERLALINDGASGAGADFAALGPTPKARILAAIDQAIAARDGGGP